MSLSKFFGFKCEVRKAPPVSFFYESGVFPLLSSTQVIKVLKVFVSNHVIEALKVKKLIKQNQKWRLDNSGYLD